jgi:hypothetical protein
MKRLIWITVLIVVVGGLVATETSAQTAPPGAWQLRILLGYAKSVETNPPPGGVGSVFGLYTQTKPALAIGFEAGFNNLGTGTYDGFDAVLQQPGQADVTLKIWPVTLQFLLQLPKGSFRPFVVGGSGLYTVNTSAQRDLSGQSYRSGTISRLGVNVGGGLALGNPENRWALLVDARYQSVFNALADDSSLGFFTIYGGFHLGL